MQREPAQTPPRSINLAPPDFLVMNGTAEGGRSRVPKKISLLAERTRTMPTRDVYNSVYKSVDNMVMACSDY
jgi:hypothetical protein